MAGKTTIRLRGRRLRLPARMTGPATGKRPKRIKLSRIRRYRGWAITAAVVGLLAIAAYSVFEWADSDATCAGCHRSTMDVAEVHESASCGSCHRPSGPTGALRHGVALASMTVVQFRSPDAIPQPGQQPEDSGCLRCHRTVIEDDGLLRAKIRVNHRHLVDAGLRCGECHTGVGHQEDTHDRPRSIMGICLRCHDGNGAQYECDVCHLSRPSDVTSDRRLHRPVRVGMGGTCAGCHSMRLEARCVACHGGYEMPHPVGWMEGAHFLPGFVDQDRCMLCHEPPRGVEPAPHGSPTANWGGGFCNRCHTFPTPHGDRNAWIKRHGPASKGVAVPQPQCTPCHSSEFVKHCTVCHAQETCDRCHADR